MEINIQNSTIVSDQKNFYESVTDDNSLKEDDPLWLIVMDQSQLIMTIVGLIANIATSITLIKNGQVNFSFLILFTSMKSITN